MSNDAGEVEDEIVQYVREWFRRVVKGTKHVWPGERELTIRLGGNEGDEDGTLYITADFEEKSRHGVEGRVSGVMLDDVT